MLGYHVLSEAALSSVPPDIKVTEIFTGATNVSGSATVVSASSPKRQAISSVSGSATISSISSNTVAGGTGLSGQATVSSKTIRITSGTIGVTGNGSFSGSARGLFTTSHTFAGSASVGAGGGLIPMLEAAINPTSSAAVGVRGSITAGGRIGVSNAISLDPQASRVIHHSSALSGQASTSLEPQRVKHSVFSPSAIASVSIKAALSSGMRVSLSSSTTLGVSNSSTILGRMAIIGGGFEAGFNSGFDGSPAAQIKARGSIGSAGRTSLQGAATLGFKGSRGAWSASLMSGPATLGAIGTAVVPVVTSISGTALLQSEGIPLPHIHINLSNNAQISAFGVLRVGARTSLSPSASLEAIGSPKFFINASLVGTATLSPSSDVFVRDVVPLNLYIVKQREVESFLSQSMNGLLYVNQAEPIDAFLEVTREQDKNINQQLLMTLER